MMVATHLVMVHGAVNLLMSDLEGRTDNCTDPVRLVVVKEETMMTAEAAEVLLAVKKLGLDNLELMTTATKKVAALVVVEDVVVIVAAVEV